MNKIKKCNKKGCSKRGKSRTNIGYFCSEKCRKEIEKNIFKFLVG